MTLEPIELVLLYDCYSALLTEKQRSCFDLYYNQDLSLSEIAEECGISRQGVYDTLARAEQLLRSTEASLGCCARELRLREAEARLSAVAARLRCTCPEEADEICSALALLEKE